MAPVVAGNERPAQEQPLSACLASNLAAAYAGNAITTEPGDCRQNRSRGRTPSTSTGPGRGQRRCRARSMALSVAPRMPWRSIRWLRPGQVPPGLSQGVITEPKRFAMGGLESALAVGETCPGRGLRAEAATSPAKRVEQKQPRRPHPGTSWVMAPKRATPRTTKRQTPWRTPRRTRAFTSALLRDRLGCCSCSFGRRIPGCMPLAAKRGFRSRLQAVARGVNG